LAVNLRSLVARLHEGFNERDLDAWSDVFDEAVELNVDGAALRGVAAARAYAAAVFREFPRLRISDARVVVESGATIVVEHQVLNGDPSSGPLRAQGSVCEIYRVREGRVVAYRSYYAPEEADREDVVNVPSRAEGSKLAEEQAALRRVATLVARGGSQDELFATVNEEIGWLVGADPTSLMRFEDDDTVTLVAAWSAAEPGFPIGASRPVDDKLRSLRDEGRALRFGPMELPLDGPLAEEARQLAIRSAIGVPIVVDGRVWGAAFAASTRDEPFAKDATTRIAGFTELLATAIANTEARTQVARLADEQAALRRVATLVARGAPTEEVFAAVTEEVGQLLGLDFAYMARYEPGRAVTTVAGWGRMGSVFAIGARSELGGKNVSTLVFETGRPARLDSYVDASGPVGVTGRESGFLSSAGSPIVVEGHTWGVVIVGSTLEPSLPADTEARLASFTGLVATAVANAESRAGLARLAEEQAALRRVATLVARGVPPEEVFAAVAEEIGRLLAVDLATMCRYEPAGAITILASWGRGAERFPVGSRWPLGGQNLGTLVFETGRPARIDPYAAATGPVGLNAAETGIGSAVGVPVIVEGRLWGAVSAGSNREQPLPADTEGRLTSFTDLAATAIANAESRAGLARLAEEQAALRRVATLVARGARADEVFAAVTQEVGRQLHVDIANLGRYERDGSVTNLAAWSRSGNAFPPVGTRWTLGAESVSTIVFETRRPARVDGYADACGELDAAVGTTGVRSAVATPILVEGRLWGLMVAGSSLEQPLPADTEARLASFTELAATAISNTEARTEVAASRARLLAATDDERRRLVRDLHDGAQQGLVNTIITLKLAHGTLEHDQDETAPALVGEALEHAERANAELRELAHGILPAVLTHGGLSAGVTALASRAPLPVEVDVSVDRLPAAVEATAYFVVAEALTNVAKHAHAGRAEVTARIDNGTLAVQVRDDGVGGARPDGSGLLGLADRVAALDGRLRIESPREGGTLVAAAIPVPG
jgi:GAF domain-containing protein